MINSYRKKPVTITAMQYTGDNLDAVKAFTNGNAYIDYRGLIIYTLEGEHIASINDYIIRGVHGEYYPCKPDIFAKTYEKI